MLLLLPASVNFIRPLTSLQLELIVDFTREKFILLRVSLLRVLRTCRRL